MFNKSLTTENPLIFLFNKIFRLFRTHWRTVTITHSHSLCFFHSEEIIIQYLIIKGNRGRAFLSLHRSICLRVLTRLNTFDQIQLIQSLWRRMFIFLRLVRQLFLLDFLLFTLLRLLLLLLHDHLSHAGSHQSGRQVAQPEQPNYPTWKTSVKKINEKFGLLGTIKKPFKNSRLVSLANAMWIWLLAWQ